MNKLLLNYTLINLGSKNLVYLITMKEGNFPKLIAKAFWKIFKVCCLISFNIFKSYQLTCLLIAKFIYQYFREYM